MLLVSSLFIRCLFSCDVLVKFLLKIPSFLSCAKTNRERASEPCPSRAGAPGGHGRGGAGGALRSRPGVCGARPFPQRATESFAIHQTEVYEQVFQEGSRFTPEKDPSPFRSSLYPSQPRSPALRDEPALWGHLGDPEAPELSKQTGRSDSDPTGQRGRLKVDTRRLVATTSSKRWCSCPASEDVARSHWVRGRVRALPI